MRTIYLDYNATTPIAPEVAEAMKPYIEECFGNPSSLHQYGIQARKAVERAREQVAQFLGCRPYEIIFTSGGTESNNHAIAGIALAHKYKGNHIITSSIEHPSVLEVCRYLEQNGFEVTYLPVDETGLIDVSELEKAIRPETIFITIMHANNEVGTIQPIEEISQVAKQHGLIFHSDAVQSAGKIPIKVDSLGVDLLSIAGHKLYGPKGIGALYIRENTKINPLIMGAGQERGLRAGTENVAFVVGLGKACEIADRELERHFAHTKEMRDRLYEGLLEKLDNVKLNGHPSKRLPNTLSISFKGVEAGAILSELTDIAASAGAACHYDTSKISHVLSAMKIPVEFAMGTIRFSTGKMTTPEEVESAVKRISNVVTRVAKPGGTSLHISPSPEKIQLTRFTAGLGCGCKLRASELDKLLEEILYSGDERVVVGTESRDDGCVYKINDREVIIQSVDFFTPIVDDPYQFGSIAAANSLSDIYAMGGKPIFALSIASFPSTRLPIETFREILKGATQKAAEAGTYILGGHTIEGHEPKFGLTVTGIGIIDKIMRNSRARSSDRIVLTKPIGTGIIATAAKRGYAEGEVLGEAMKVMNELNDVASEIAMEFGVKCCTDVTGFGLLGHLLQMCRASGVSAIIWTRQVPVIKSVRSYAEAGFIPGGAITNMEYVSRSTIYDETLSETEKKILCDPQTSGGLLFAVKEKSVDSFIDTLKKHGVEHATCIGYFSDKRAGQIIAKK